MTVTTRNRLAVGILIALLVAVAVVYYPGGAGDALSSDPEERLAAIRDLAGKTDEDSVKILRRLSDDTNPRVALAAVNAIGKSHDHDNNREALLEVLAEGKTGVARGAAAAALGNCRQVDVALLTRTLLDNKEHPQARAGAAKGLSRRRDAAALPQLVRALRDSDPRVRLWAITAIGRTTAQRFKYDPQRPPDEQNVDITFIERTLRDKFPHRFGPE